MLLNAQSFFCRNIKSRLRPLMTDTATTNIIHDLNHQVQLTDPGVPGLTGLHVPGAVVEELRPGGDSVTVRPRPTVVLTVRVKALRRNRVKLTLVFQVNINYS